MSYLNNLPPGLLLAISITITVVGDFIAKYWSLHSGRTWLWWITMACWMIANVFFMPSLLKKSLITSGLTFTVGNILGFTMVGLLLFGESITAMQGVGIGLAFVAIILLNI